MLWHNTGIAGTHSGIIGHDFGCKQCPECGGYPIRVDYDFNVNGEKIYTIIRGKKKVVSRERRTYYHCQCGHCTTEWKRPVYDKDGVIVTAAWAVAHDAYQNGEFVESKSDE